MTNDDDDDAPAVVATRIGGVMQLVDFDVYADCHSALSRHFAELGYEGRELDVAIVNAMPSALARALAATRH